MPLSSSFYGFRWEICCRLHGFSAIGDTLFLSECSQEFSFVFLVQKLFWCGFLWACSDCWINWSTRISPNLGSFQTISSNTLYVPFWFSSPFRISNIRSFLSFLPRSLRFCSFLPSLLFRLGKCYWFVFKFTSSMLCHLNSTFEHIQQVLKSLLFIFHIIYIWFIYDSSYFLIALSVFFPICLKIIYDCVLKHFYDGCFKLPLR